MVINLPLWAIPLIALAVVSAGLLLWLIWSIIQVWDVNPWS